MKICSVIVTYGDRFHLLKQVIDASFKVGINKVIVIDNGSVDNSKKQLKEYEKNEDRLNVVYLDANYGSAGGYKKGLEVAYNDPECEYIWLLDDDNKPQKDSLKILKEFWNSLDEKNKKENVSLLSYRKDRIAYKEAIMTNNSDLVLGKKNSFLGFHFLDLPKKIIKVIKRKIGLQTFIENSKVKSGKVAVAPYGGMFFHKSLINNIGYPREEFFVYADDYEWSYRITKDGGKIYFILGSEIEDIETSLGFRGKKHTSLFYSLLNKSEGFRLYYSTRNRIVFENSFCDNCLIYNINKYIFNLILRIYKNQDNDNNYKIYTQAIIDGFNNNFRYFHNESKK